MNNIPDYIEYQHNGYILRQFNNVWHYQINDGKTGKTLVCASASKKLTEDEAKQTIDEFIFHQKKITDKDRIRVCPICSTEFEVSHHRYTYCSNECASKAQRINTVKARKIRDQKKRELKALHKQATPTEPEKRTCGCCGKLFIPSCTYRSYCSNACKLKKRYYYKPIRPRKKKQSSYKNDSLCWSCVNACGGCSWSNTLTPVEGWTAEPVKMKRNCTIPSYKVIKCPKYEKGIKPLL